MTERSKKFRLDAVLRVARIRQKQAEGELARRLADERQAEETRRQRAAAYDARPAERPAPAPQFEAERATAERRAAAATQAAGDHEAARDHLRAARDTWAAAARRRRSVDELEERHHATRAAIASRAAQRALDDLSRARRRS